MCPLLALLRPDPGRRPDLGRTLLALSLSVGLHALLAMPVLWLRLLPALLPGLPIAVEVLSPRRLALPEAADRPAGPPAEQQGGSSPPVRRPHRPRDPLPAVQPLDRLGPEEASVLVVVRLDALRASPHRSAAEALLGSFPDARLLAAGALPSGQALAARLVQEAEALLVTTTDPYDLLATTLLAVHPPVLDLPGLLAGRHQPRWDPRVLERLDERITVFGAEQERAFFRARLQADRKTLGRLLSSGAALSAEVRHLDRLVRLGDGLPTPRMLRLAVSAEARPALRLELHLLDEADARALAAVLPELLGRLRDRVRLLGLAPLVAGLRTTRRGSTVLLGGHLPTAEVTLLLSLLQLRLQLLPLPGDDSPPPDLGTD
ncbi:MAG: hypothetical protein NZ890_00965 [Myxococcota bacterium]|nr:hypothetical protein [Myxococcota bacterium]